MAITDRALDQAYAELKHICGGTRNDYFGLLYLQQEHDVPQDKARNQVAFGGNDYGLDGYHFDEQRRNLYLFQFKYSKTHAQFKGSLQRLIDVGMDRIFLTPHVVDNKNQILLQLRSCMVDNRALIDQVCFRFVFLGDPAEAERSQVLDKLREDLENKKYIIDRFFQGRQVTLVVEFRSAAGKVAPLVDQRFTHAYSIPATAIIERHGPDHELMYVGFVSLIGLHKMLQDMGQRFFERNIRYGLGQNQAVNRRLVRAFRAIVLDRADAPQLFSFNHNGITLYAQHVECGDGDCRLTEPRLLNGAQTLAALDDFLKRSGDDPRLKQGRDVLGDIQVLAKIITNAKEAFVTAVTINNNRQNPVEPWNLRANDRIQLELHDRFNEHGIYYERQENAFANLSPEEMDEAGIREAKAVHLVKLAQTFAISDGDIDKLSRMRDAFEDDRIYSQLFCEARLRTDVRKIILCYKIQFRLRKLLNEIAEKGKSKYWFIHRARNLLWALLCQGVLNDRDIDSMAETYGIRMSVEADYTARLVTIATTRCRPMIAELVAQPEYAEILASDNRGNFGFLRSNNSFSRCMKVASSKWKWAHRKLK